MLLLCVYLFVCLHLLCVYLFVCLHLLCVYLFVFTGVSEQETLQE